MARSFAHCAHYAAPVPMCSVTEAGTPVTTAWFLWMVERTGRAAKLPFAVHPHMLRHACGFKLEISTQPVAVSACSSFSSEPLISRSPSVGTS